MVTAEPIASLTISVFTRHTKKCPKLVDPQWKRCKCRKSIYIQERGKTQYLSAKTRSWEVAERVAQEERDARDPVKLELQKIAESEAAKRAIEETKQTSMEAALDQWLTGMKTIGVESMAAYLSTKRRILRWAKFEGIRNVSDATPALLDSWRASWSPDAPQKENRLALTTQVTLQTRMKSIFRWAHSVGMVLRDPAKELKSITPGESDTMPLTPERFEELLEACPKINADLRYADSKIGEHLRVVFLLQLWTGHRIGDVLQIRRWYLTGNRLTLKMQKRGNDHECVLPDHVIAALNSLPPLKWADPDCYFVRAKTRIRTETNQWVRKVRILNKRLSFKHPKTGEPMEFRSHMLRDTFAIEMLIAGVPLEKVSKLLGHKSVLTTERYYAKWVPERLRLLEDEAVAAMRRMGGMVGGK